MTGFRQCYQQLTELKVKESLFTAERLHFLLASYQAMFSLSELVIIQKLFLSCHALSAPPLYNNNKSPSGSLEIHCVTTSLTAGASTKLPSILMWN